MEIELDRKCRVIDCNNSELSSSRLTRNRPGYCLQHAIKYGLIVHDGTIKVEDMCNNDTCIKRGTVLYKDRKMYCNDYAILSYHNNISSIKYSKCSEVAYLICMHKNCWSVPYRLVYTKLFKGYYCDKHYYYLKQLILSVALPPLDPKYVPTSDDWIEYALDNIDFSDLQSNSRS